MAYDLDECRMGVRCRTRETRPGNVVVPGFADGRGLCWPDELHGRFAINSLPAQYVALIVRSRKDAGRNGISAMGGHQAEAPIPIRPELDALAREIAWTLDVWAAPVFERIPVAERGRHRDFAERGIRMGWAVGRSAVLLDRWYPVLRSLTPYTFMQYKKPGDELVDDLAEDDGPGAVVQLVDLHHRCRSALGETRRLEHRDLPCPPAPDGCGEQQTLVRELGDTTVWCTNCGWWCTDEAYTQYALTFVPPKLGRCPGCRARVAGEHTADCQVAVCLETGLPRENCEHDHDHGRDVWTGIWPGVSEARQYGVDLATLSVLGQWDAGDRRWHLPEQAGADA